jgi:WD40 repeat protein
MKNFFVFIREIIPEKSWCFVFIILLLCSFSSAAAKEEDSEKLKKDYFLSQSLKLGKKPVQTAVFSPNDQQAAILSGSSSLEIFRIQNGKSLRVISSYEHKAISLVLHAGGKLVVTGGQDDTVRIWSTDQSTAQAVMRGHLSAVSVLALHTGGEILASGSLDGTVILWNMKEHELLKSTKVIGKSSIKSLAFHPNGRILAIGGEDGSLQFRSIPEMKLITILSGHKNSINDLEFNPRGDLFVSGSEEGKVIIWDWKVKKQRFKINFEDAVSTISIHPKLAEIVVGTAGGKLETWSLAKGTLLHQITESGPLISSTGYDRNGRRIFSALEDGTVEIWENGVSLHLKTFSGHERIVESLDFSSNNKFLISSSSDKSVRIWDLKTNENIRNFDIGNHRVQDLRFAPGSQQFATAGTDSSVRIWDAIDGRRIHNLKFHKGKINTISYHPEDSVLLSTGSDRKWVLWDLVSGKSLLSHKGHTSQILAASFSPDGKRFATAGSDLFIKIWEYPQGKELGKLKGHKKPVTTLAFSPDGKLLASGSQDNQIFLWRLEPEISKTPFRKLEGHSYIVTQVFFSKAGKALISISKDKTMRLWEVKSGKMRRILHGDSTPLVAAALSPDGKLIALSNLTNDITILTFPTDIPEFQDDTGDVSAFGETDNSASFQTSESDSDASDKYGIDLENLKEMEKLPMTAEELRAYAVTETDDLSTVQYEMQQRLNLLLKTKDTCLHAAEMKKLALEILVIVPDDLAAYHALVKTSILKQDFATLSLFVSSGYFAELDQELYDYMSILEIRNIFDNLRFELFDQSFVRQGNKQKIKLANCKGNPLSVSLSGIPRNLRYPVEFLKNINSIPRLIDLREYMNLPQKEFQDRMFAEIERILGSRTPHPTSYLLRTPEERSEKVSVGILNLNLEKAQTWKNDGMASFSLRKVGGQWQSYQTDRDNRIVMHLPAGSYSLKVAGVLRKTFFLIAGTQLDLSID